MNSGSSPILAAGDACLLRVGAVADDRGERPGPWLVRVLVDRFGGATISEIQSDRSAAVDLDRPGAVLVPAFVNAHTHLDLTDVGIRPFGGSFDAWLEMVMDARPRTAEAIRAAVVAGVRLSRAGGVVAVGDIAGAPGSSPELAAMFALDESGMGGVSFMEFFAIGARERHGIDTVHTAFDGLPASRNVRFGVQPHAPYTVSNRGYAAAAAIAGTHGAPISTHLAESPSERRFVADGEGPTRDFLERLGLWTSAEEIGVGEGLSPTAYLARAFGERGRGVVAAHGADLSDEDIELLAQLHATVVYCPRSATYFGFDLAVGAHRYRDLLDAGVNVCFGTDSIINLDTPDRISPLDDARLVVRRDGLDPVTALAMLTTYPARGLGLDPAKFRVEPGSPIEGILCLPTDEGSGRGRLAGVFENGAAPEVLTLAAGRAVNDLPATRGDV